MNASPFAKYLMTVGELSRKTHISAATVRLYADLGLVECFYTTRGDRLFLQEAVDQALLARASRRSARSEAA